MRMLAISKRYLFSPPLSRVSWKRSSWVRGEQAATTTRFKFLSRMISAIRIWVSWEQVKRFSSTWTTEESPRAYSTTSPTRITPPMLLPQLQTNTPIRGCWPRTSVSVGRGVCRARECLTGASLRVAAQAEAEASTTDWGMSLGPAKAPQA